MITERNGEMEDPQSAYSVELDIFNGPLDLLLHLIKRNEVNIYDLPIALIIKQYLEYLDFLKDVNLEIVGDYMSMAAELGYIKSRMLLPRIKDEDEDEGQDPREELVRQLLEYERYRDAAAELGGMEILGKDVFLAGYDRKEVFGEPAEETEFVKFDLWSLVDAFSNIYESRKKSEIEEISLTPQTYRTVEEKKKPDDRNNEKQKRGYFRRPFRRGYKPHGTRGNLSLHTGGAAEIAFQACDTSIFTGRLFDGILDVFQPTFEEPIKIILREKNGR